MDFRVNFIHVNFIRVNFIVSIFRVNFMYVIKKVDPFVFVDHLDNIFLPFNWVEISNLTTIWFFCPKS
jgi:hypothetical protein